MPFDDDARKIVSLLHSQPDEARKLLTSLVAGRAGYGAATEIVQTVAKWLWDEMQGTLPGTLPSSTLVGSTWPDELRNAMETGLGYFEAFDEAFSNEFYPKSHDPTSGDTWASGDTWSQAEIRVKRNLARFPGVGNPSELDGLYNRILDKRERLRESCKKKHRGLLFAPLATFDPGKLNEYMYRVIAQEGDFWRRGYRRRGGLATLSGGDWMGDVADQTTIVEDASEEPLLDVFQLIQQVRGFYEDLYADETERRIRICEAVIAWGVGPAVPPNAYALVCDDSTLVRAALYLKLSLGYRPHRIRDAGPGKLHGYDDPYAPDILRAQTYAERSASAATNFSRWLRKLEDLRLRRVSAATSIDRSAIDREIEELREKLANAERAVVAVSPPARFVTSIMKKQLLQQLDPTARRRGGQRFAEWRELLDEVNRFGQNYRTRRKVLEHRRLKRRYRRAQQILSSFPAGTQMPIVVERIFRLVGEQPQSPGQTPRDPLKLAVWQAQKAGYDQSLPRWKALLRKLVDRLEGYAADLPPGKLLAALWDLTDYIELVLLEEISLHSARLLRTWTRLAHLLRVDSLSMIDKDLTVGADR